MRGLRQGTLILAVLAAAICLVNGVVYIGASRSAGMADIGPWLATLGTLGGTALGAAGLWQYTGGGVPRLIALVTLSALAAGYVAANVLALVQGSANQIPQTPRPLHVAGLVAGAGLYLVSLVAASLAFRGRRGTEG